MRKRRARAAARLPGKLIRIAIIGIFQSEFVNRFRPIAGEFFFYYIVVSLLPHGGRLC